MSSPRVLSRPGQKVFIGPGLGYRAYIKYLLYFCKMSLNVSFWGRGGGREREKKSCNVVPMQLLTSRVQPGFWSSSFLFLFRVFIADAVCRAWG